MNSKRNKKSGFSLAELVIVIVVIGILAAVGFSAIGAWETASAESNMTQDGRTVANTAKLYFQQNPGVTTITAAALQTFGDITLSPQITLSAVTPTTFTLTHPDVNSGTAVTYSARTGREQ